jgi:hypothetical protein
MINNAELKTIIDKARVARLATVNLECRPHLVLSVVFTFDGEYYYIPIDNKKTKREPSKPERVKRVKNIQANQILRTYRRK